MTQKIPDANAGRGPEKDCQGRGVFRRQVPRVGGCDVGPGEGNAGRVGRLRVRARWPVWRQLRSVNCVLGTVQTGVRVPCGGQTVGGSWKRLWACEWERGGSVGIPQAAGEVFGGGREAGQCWLPAFLIHPSHRALGVSGQAPGTTQTPPEPGVPAPDPLGPCHPHTPGEVQTETGLSPLLPC